MTEEAAEKIAYAIRVLEPAERLSFFVRRIESLEAELKSYASDIKDVFTEAKSAGFDVKAVRQILSLRKKDPAEVEKQETLLNLCKRALGM
jgi:uncharacterized protein (UPF0335 family)